MRKLLIIAFLTSMTLPAVSSQNTNDEKYFTITSITNEYLGETKGGTVPLNGGGNNNAVPAPDQLPKPPDGPVINPPVPGGGGNNGGDLIVILDKIINLGEKIFGIIERNKPVVNISVNYANAVPYGVTHWTQLAGWKPPKTKKYAFTAKNGYGTDVVKVVYQVHWTYDGNLKGKGKFLTGVTVEPIDVQVAWGYKVDLKAEVPDSTVANVGTSEDPIASMQVQLKWKIATVFKEINQKTIYYVQGDGFIKEIATPFEEKRKAEEDARIKWEKALELILNSSWN